MGSKQDLEHALHNEEVFQYLLLKKEFTDWIVTTAFYSALHFVDYKLFPKTYIDKTVKITISDMDSYVFYILDTGEVAKNLPYGEIRFVSINNKWDYKVFNKEDMSRIEKQIDKMIDHFLILNQSTAPL